MRDDNTTDSGDKPRSGSFAASRNLIIVAVAVALLIGVGVGALAFGQGSDSGASEEPAVADQTAKPDSAPAQTDPFVEFPPQFRKEPGSKYDAQFATASMFPLFNPARDYYVTRCAPGKIAVNVRAKEGTTVKVGTYPPRSGDFIAEARILPSQNFEVRVNGPDGSKTYNVRCLPEAFPEWSYRRYSTPPKGRFLVSMRPLPGDTSANWVVVFDQDGTPRWWKAFPYNSVTSEVLADGTVQLARGFGDGFGQDERNGHEIRSLDGDLVREMKTRGVATDGHEFTQLPNGNALLVAYRPRLGVDLSRFGLEKNGGVLDGEIQEVTPDGEVVWTWNSGDHISLDETPERWWEMLRNNPQPDNQGRVRYDVFHINSVEPWGNQYVVSSRHTDRVYGISRQNGEVIWTLGGEQGPKSLEIIGPDPYKDYPLGGQHDARMIDGNVVQIFDNGTNLDDDKRPPRVVRYRIDPEAGTATFVSQVEDTEVAPVSHCCGGVRAFGDGTIVSWGNSPVVSGFGPDDQLAFRLWMPIPMYRAIPVPPSVSDTDLDRGLEAMEVLPPAPSEPVLPFKNLPPQE
jgi:hypothetical protein